jgi:hypothetical protein
MVSTHPNQEVTKRENKKQKQKTKNKTEERKTGEGYLSGDLIV